MGKKILVVDSGIGGISTLVEIRRRFEHADILYFADDVFMPYGSKSKIDLIDHLANVLERFENDICGVVFACNTATGVAAELLRKVFCFDIVGTEPAVVPACADKERTLVLVTPLESRQIKFERLIVGKNVLVSPRPNLAAKIEKCLGKYGSVLALEKSKGVLSEVEEIKNILAENNIKKIVLGCTHYVFLKYTKLLNDFTLFDGNVGVAAQARRVFADVGGGETEFVFASGNKKKSQLALRLFEELSNFGL